MVVNEFWILLLGGKNEKLRRRLNLAETDRGSYYKEEWLEEFFDSEGAFYNCNESDNNDESL